MLCILIVSELTWDWKESGIILLGIRVYLPKIAEHSKTIGSIKDTINLTVTRAAATDTAIIRVLYSIGVSCSKTYLTQIQ